MSTLAGMLLNALAASSLTALLFLGGCAYQRPDLPEPARIEEAVLFPSNQRVMANYCRAGLSHQRTCHLAAWDLDGGNVKVYAAPKGHSWRDARFSPDGTEFVFELNDTGRFSTKLAIMNLATDRWRIVEGSDSFKNYPSYHPDGGKLIYIIAARTPDNHKIGTRARLDKVDVHSLDLKTGESKALTDYEFFQTSRPYFTGRGDEFVFNGYNPSNAFRETNNTGGDTIGYSEYAELYQGNTIITINEGKNSWRPDFVIYDDPTDFPRAYSGSPVPSQNGSILYFQSNKGKVGRYRNSDLSTAIWKRENGKNERVAYFKSITGLRTYSSNFSLSADEAFFLVWSRITLAGAEESEESLWRVRVDGPGSQRIPIPWARLAVFTRTAAKTD